MFLRTNIFKNKLRVYEDQEYVIGFYGNIAITLMRGSPRDWINAIQPILSEQSAFVEKPE